VDPYSVYLDDNIMHVEVFLNEKKNTFPSFYFLKKEHIFSG
jgi:hypothetical protein